VRMPANVNKVEELALMETVHNEKMCDELAYVWGPVNSTTN